MVYKKESQRRSYWRDVLERFTRHKLAMGGLIIILAELAVVIFLPLVMKLNPYSMDAVGGFGAAPSAAHILGTDEVGRDVFARLIYGGRTSLFVGILSAFISLSIGVPLGLIAGYLRGALGIVIMRLADVFMSVPSMILVLVLVAVIGPSIQSVTIVIGIMGWPQFARQMYGSVLSVREKDYVEAAVAIGEKNGRIMRKYILPNAFAPVIITFTFSIASAVLQESGLSFLGMGVQTPQASWGNIMYAAQSITILSQKPWMWIPPGVALLLTVLSFNFFGDGIRDALDPKMKL